MTTKTDEFLNQIRDAHRLLARARADASLDGPVTKDMDSVAAVIDGALTFASTWGLGAEPDPNLILRISEPGTVGIGQIRDEIIAFIDRVSGGQFHGIEHLTHETLHARRSPDPELEAAGQRILEDIRATRRTASDILDRFPRSLVAQAMIEVQARLNQILRDIATSPDPGALRAKLVELVSIRNVGGPVSPEPYPASADDVADEIAVFVDELDFTGAARGLRLKVSKRLDDLDQQRIAQERQARIAAVLREITDDHLRPALEGVGIILPEGYVLKWQEGDGVPG